MLRTSDGRRSQHSQHHYIIAREIWKLKIVYITMIAVI